MKRLLTATLALLCALPVSAGVSIERWTTASGARVQYVSSRALPILDIQISFAAGSIFDPVGKNGLAALTRGVLDLGAGGKDENALAEQLADVGATLGGGADTDAASITLRTLATPEQRNVALDVLGRVLRAPAFDAAVFEREKARTVASLKDAMTRPDSIAGKAFWAAMYPGHPYGRQATPETVAALNRDDLLAFHARYYTAANATVTLVGDVSREEASRIADELLAGLPAGKAVVWPEAPADSKGGTQKLAHPASQSHIYIGLPAIARGDPDYFALLVGNYTLGGGGFVSRLVKEVRDKRGFAYSVYSYFAPMKQRGPFQIGLQTKRSQAAEAVKVVLAELDAYLAKGPSAEELAAAKANLSGSFPLKLDSNSKLLANVAAMGFYGLPDDYLETYQARIQAVTVDDVKKAFARHVHPRRLMTVVVAAD